MWGMVAPFVASVVVCHICPWFGQTSASDHFALLSALLSASTTLVTRPQREREGWDGWCPVALKGLARGFEILAVRPLQAPRPHQKTRGFLRTTVHVGWQLEWATRIPSHHPSLLREAVTETSHCSHIAPIAPWPLALLPFGLAVDEKTPLESSAPRPLSAHAPPSKTRCGLLSTREMLAGRRSGRQQRRGSRQASNTGKLLAPTWRRR